MHSAQFGSISQSSNANPTLLWCCRLFGTGSAVANEVPHKSLIPREFPILPSQQKGFNGLNGNSPLCSSDNSANRQSYYTFFYFSPGFSLILPHIYARHVVVVFRVVSSVVFFVGCLGDVVDTNESLVIIIIRLPIRYKNRLWELPTRRTP